jgi:hypothetical protein
LTQKGTQKVGLWRCGRGKKIPKDGRGGEREEDDPESEGSLRAGRKAGAEMWEGDPPSQVADVGRNILRDGLMARKEGKQGRLSGGVRS